MFRKDVSKDVLVLIIQASAHAALEGPLLVDIRENVCVLKNTLGIFKVSELTGVPL